MLESFYEELGIGSVAMYDNLDQIEQNEEHVFACDVSDEALEASGGGAAQILFSLIPTRRVPDSRGIHESAGN